MVQTPQSGIFKFRGREIHHFRRSFSKNHPNSKSSQEVLSFGLRDPIFFYGCRFLYGLMVQTPQLGILKFRGREIHNFRRNFSKKVLSFGLRGPIFLRKQVYIWPNGTDPTMRNFQISGQQNLSLLAKFFQNSPKFEKQLGSPEFWTNGIDNEEFKSFVAAKFIIFGKFFPKFTQIQKVARKS